MVELITLDARGLLGRASRARAAVDQRFACNGEAEVVGSAG